MTTGFHYAKNVKFCFYFLGYMLRTVCCPLTITKTVYDLYSWLNQTDCDSPLMDIDPYHILNIKSITSHI